MAYPSDLTRTKNWGTEVLTDSDLEGQLDLIINWAMAGFNASTGHSHDGTSNQGPKINITNLTVSSQAQGDIYYASSASANARLGAGTAGYLLNTGGASANPSWRVPPVAGGFSNLSVSRTNVTTCAITADRLVVFDTNNVGWLCTSVSVSPAITASGANGLDTGAEGSSTWYYLWVIRKSSDGTVAGLLSTSSTAPTMPSGYDQKVLVSAVRNDGSSNFVDFKDNGRRYNYVSWPTISSGNLGSGAWTSVDVTGYVPSGISNFCYGSFYDGGSLGCVSNDSSVATGSTEAANKFVGKQHGLFWQFSVLTANTLYALSDNANFVMRISGFDKNKLG